MTAQESRPLPLEKAVPVLAMHVSQVQRRMGAVALQTGLAMAFPILVGWLALTMPLDWYFELPWPVRAVLLLAGFGSAAFVAWRYGLRSWFHKPAEDHVALAIERALPELRSRFIASIQLSRQMEDHAQPLVRALVKETVELTRELEFRSVVPTEPRTRWLKCSAAAAVAGALLWWIGDTASWPLFQRAWLLNVAKPTDTILVSFTGDRAAAVGDDLRLEANVRGVVPSTGKLKIQTDGKPTREFTLEMDPKVPHRFGRNLQSVQESFSYWLEIGDARTPRAQVRVRPRPTVMGLTLEQHWPPYTQLPPQLRNPSDLKLLAGSRLAVALTPNGPLATAHLHLLDPTGKVGTSVALAPEPAPATGWTGRAQIPAKDVTGMTFQLADQEGVGSRGMAVYRIEIVPDQPPTLAVLWPPRREELVTARATLLIAFEAKDDFGIGTVKLHYAVNWAEGSPHRTLDLDLGNDAPNAITRRFEWNLARLTPPLKEGDVVDYWFEAVDTNDVTGPGVTSLADHYQARVVSESEKRADLAARLTDTLQGLNDVRQNQEALARQLGDLIYEKPPER